MRAFVYVLKPVPRLLTESNWTAADTEAVNRHFAHLQSLLSKGTLILAGKTDGLDDETFGLVIFEAEDIDAARKLMRSDPAIQAGIMEAKLFPYTVALLRA